MFKIIVNLGTRTYSTFYYYCKYYLRRVSSVNVFRVRLQGAFPEPQRQQKRDQGHHQRHGQHLPLLFLRVLFHPPVSQSSGGVHGSGAYEAPEGANQNEQRQLPHAEVGLVFVDFVKFAEVEHVHLLI